jgi:MscS family membrane protein
MKAARFVFLIAGLGLFLGSYAQDYPLDQKTPQSTVYKHLFYLQDEGFNPILSGETMYPGSPANKGELAEKLKQILDSRGVLIDLESLPRDPNFSDTLTGRNRFGLSKEIPGIYLEKYGNLWYFNRETTELIPHLYRRTFPFGTGNLPYLFPSIRQNEFLGLKLWQWFVMLGIVLLYIILQFIFTRIIEVVTAFLIRSPYVPKEQRIATHKMAIPLSWFLQLHIVQLFIPAIQFPVNISHFILLVFHLLGPVVLSFTLWRAVDLIIYFVQKRAEKTATTLDDQLVPLLKKTFQVMVVGIGLVLMLRALNFNLAAVIAGASIGGLALALAAQDTIKNMFGSLMVFIDKPYQIGDWIQAPGVDGTVESVGFRATRVRTFANSLVYVPNGKMSEMLIDNYGARKYRRFRTILSVEYNTPPEKIERFVAGLRERVAQHPHTRKDVMEIHLNDFNHSSLDILFYIFFEVPNWSMELRARQEMMIAILQLAKALEIQFAFPTQTLHIASTPNGGNPT